MLNANARKMALTRASGANMKNKDESPSEAYQHWAISRAIIYDVQDRAVWRSGDVH